MHSIEQTKPQNNSPSVSGLNTIQGDAVGGDKVGQDKVGRDKIVIVDKRTINIQVVGQEEPSPLRRWLEWAIIIGQIVQLLLG